MSGWRVEVLLEPARYAAGQPSGESRVERYFDGAQGARDYAREASRDGLARSVINPARVEVYRYLRGDLIRSYGP